MVPRIIHCFWAKGPKTKLAERCLASWRKFAPGWEVREWDLAQVERLARAPRFFADAVAAGKWAFAADWVRFWALGNEGGVYFDFDQELVGPIGELPEGEWCAGERRLSGSAGFAPGAGLALERGSPVAQAMLDYYASAPFDAGITVGEVMDRRIRMRVLAPEVMCPIGFDGKLRRTVETVGIHWYAMSWASPLRRVTRWLSWHGCRRVVDVLVGVKRKLTGGTR